MENKDNTQQLEESLNKLSQEQLEAEVDKIFNNNQEDNELDEENDKSENDKQELETHNEQEAKTNDEQELETNDNEKEEEMKMLEVKKKKIQDEKEQKINQINEKEKIEEIEDLNLNMKKFTEKENEKKMQLELLLKIFRILNYNVESIKDILEITLYRDKLTDKQLRKTILELIPELKEQYKSAYLTCLHDNSIYKQKQPVINLLRQILKCNHLILKPKIVSNGYEKITGKKKVMRMFIIEKAVY